MNYTMAGGGIPLDKAELLAIFLETLCYGIFFTLFCITLYVLFAKSNGSPTVNRPLVITSCVMMFLATGHVVIDFIRVNEAFINKRQAKGGAIGYYSNITHPLHLTKSAFYVTQTLAGDTLATWRCFVVHGRNWFVVAFPIILLVSCAVTGYVGIWTVSTAQPGSSIFDTSSTWITCFFVITLSVNLYCTGLIVYPIWSSNKTSGDFRQHDLTPVLLALVESGALYSTALLAVLIAYLAGTNGQYIALDIVTPLVGIVFSMIIIQINVYVTTRVSQNSAQGRIAPPGSAFPMQAVSVEIMQTTHADRDTGERRSIVNYPQVYTKEVWNDAA